MGSPRRVLEFRSIATKWKTENRKQCNMEGEVDPKPLKGRAGGVTKKHDRTMQLLRLRTKAELKLAQGGRKDGKVA